MVVTRNDREFACEANDGDDCGVGTGVGRSALTLDARVLDTDELRVYLDRTAVTLADSVDEYKRWLESREAEFELRYLANDFSRDVTLFNRLNGVVSRLRQARKRLNGWYSRMQELLATALDLLGTYTESAAIVQSYAQPDVTAVSVGVAFVSPLAQAKRNVSKVRSVQRHLNTLAYTESRLKTTVISLRTQMEAFARGVIRNDGKLLDLAEVGKLVNELMGGETPLLRVQQQLADTINATRANVRVTRVSPGAPFVVDGGATAAATSSPASTAASPARSPPVLVPFLESVRYADPSEADGILDRLRSVSETTLYTESTRENIENIARLAQSRINEQDTDRRAHLESLLMEIRGNTPGAVINRYGQQARRSDGVFLRLRRLELVIANLQPADRELYERPLREIYAETYEEARRTTDRRLNDVAYEDELDVVSGTYDESLTLDAATDRLQATE